MSRWCSPEKTTLFQSCRPWSAVQRSQVCHPGPLTLRLLQPRGFRDEGGGRLKTLRYEIPITSPVSGRGLPRPVDRENLQPRTWPRCPHRSAEAYAGPSHSAEAHADPDCSPETHTYAGPNNGVDDHTGLDPNLDNHAGISCSQAPDPGQKTCDSHSKACNFCSKRCHLGRS